MSMPGGSTVAAARSSPLLYEPARKLPEIPRTLIASANVLSLWLMCARTTGGSPGARRWKRRLNYDAGSTVTPFRSSSGRMMAEVFWPP